MKSFCMRWLSVALTILLFSVLPAAAKETAPDECRHSLSAIVGSRLLDQLGGKKAAYAGGDIAGIHIAEDNRLVVSVTNQAASERIAALLTEELVGTAVDELAARYGGTLPVDEATLTDDLYTIRIQPYSISYLQSIQEALTPQMTRFGIYQLGLNEATNRLMVSIESADNREPMFAFLRDEVPNFEEQAVALNVEKNNIQLDIARSFVPNWRGILLIAGAALLAVILLVVLLLRLRKRRKQSL